MFRTAIKGSTVARTAARRAVRLNTVRAITIECGKKSLIGPQIGTANGGVQKWTSHTMRRMYSSLPDHIKVLLPALSPTMEEGTVVSWEKKEGDKLNEGDLLAEIETDKATMAFETPDEGYLAKILVPGGSKGIPIGKLVCIIVQDEADIVAFKDYKDEGGPVKAAAPVAPAPPAQSVSAAPPPPTPQPVAPPPPVAAPPPTQSGARVYASPMAKRLAEQQNIRLQGKGTGLYDSITSSDLARLAAAGSAPSAAAPVAAGPTIPAGASYVDIPVTKIREVIAKRLLESKVTIPHYYVTIHTNVDKILALRARFNKKLEKKGVKLSVNDFIIKAVALASLKVPEANSSWLNTVIRQYKNVDVSVAVATDRGLITPIIFEANNKGVVQISNEVKVLAAKARDGKLQPQEYQGGTISISNLGMWDVDQFTAIINPPQSCILAVGNVTSKLVIDDSTEKGFRETKTMSVTLSSDHRTVDGAIAAKWMQAFRENIEDPETMIL